MARAAKPLAGRRAVVTRAPEQAAELVETLEGLGAEVLLLPTVAFAPPEDFAPLDSVLAELPRFDWILLTSQNAVRFFVNRLITAGRFESSAARLAKVRAAAVGPATAEAAIREGFRVDYVAQNHTGEALVRELAGELRGRRVLLPRSDRADDRVPSALRAVGAAVTEVVAYRTAAPESLDARMLERLRRGGVDAIIFASPSAFHNLCRWITAPELAELSRRVQFTAIGASTAGALRQAGIQVEIEAPEASASALANAMANHYERRSPIGRRA